MKRANRKRTSVRKVLASSTFSAISIKIAGTLLLLIMNVAFAEVLGAHSFGLYTFAISAATLLAIPAQTGIPTLLVREVSASLAVENYGRAKGVIIFSFACLIFFVSIAVLIGYLLYSEEFLFDKNNEAIFYAIILVVPLLSLSKLLSASIQGFHKPVLSFFPDALIRPAFAILALILVKNIYVDGERQAIIANIIGYSVSVFLLIFLVLWKTGIRDVLKGVGELDARAWRRSLIPLSMLSGSAIVNTQTDVIMLGWLTNPEDVGAYKIAVQGVAIIVFATQALNLVSASKYAHLAKRKELAKIKRLLKRNALISLGFSFLMLLGFIFFGKFLISFLSDPNFLNAYGPLILLGGFHVACTIFGQLGLLMNMSNNEWGNVTAFGVSAVMNVCLNYLMIPDFGVMGAAAATGFSLLSRNFILYLIVKREFGFSLSVMTNEKA